MSTISIGRNDTAARIGLTRLAAAVQRLWVACVTWRIEQAAIMTLRGMSDHELNDIGLPRSQIAGAVKGPQAGAGRQPTSNA